MFRFPALSNLQFYMKRHWNVRLIQVTTFCGIITCLELQGWGERHEMWIIDPCIRQNKYGGDVSNGFRGCPVLCFVPLNVQLMQGDYFLFSIWNTSFAHSKIIIDTKTIKTDINLVPIWFCSFSEFFFRESSQRANANMPPNPGLFRLGTWFCFLGLSFPLFLSSFLPS